MKARSRCNRERHRWRNTFQDFATAHPEITLSAVNAVPAVHAMIVRAGGRVATEPFDDDDRQPTLEFPE